MIWVCCMGLPNVTSGLREKTERCLRPEMASASLCPDLQHNGGQKASSIQKSSAVTYLGVMAYQNHAPLLFMKSHWPLQHRVKVSPHRQHRPFFHSRFQRAKIVLRIANPCQCCNFSASKLHKVKVHVSL